MIDNGYRVILADDHVMLRQGLRRILEGVGDLMVVGEADDGLQLLEVLREERADLAVVDVSMPGLRGIEAVREALAIQSNLRVLVLTMHREVGLVRAALAAGARGYLLKDDAPMQLFAAIQTIRNGGVFVSPRLANELAADWASTEVQRSGPLPAALSTREREVLKLVVEGKSSKDIAAVLNISYRTVEHHRSSLRAKTGLHSIADLVMRALEGGFL